MANLKIGKYRILYATIVNAETRLIPGKPQVCGAIVAPDDDYSVISRIPELAGCPHLGAKRGKLKHAHPPLYVWLCLSHAHQ